MLRPFGRSRGILGWFSPRVLYSLPILLKVWHRLRPRFARFWVDFERIWVLEVPMFPSKKRSIAMKIRRGMLANVAESLQHADLVLRMCVHRLQLIFELNLPDEQKVNMNCLPFLRNLPMLIGGGGESIAFAQDFLKQAGMLWKDLILQWNRGIPLDFWVVSDHCHTDTWHLPNVAISVFTAIRVELSRLFVRSSPHGLDLLTVESRFIYTYMVSNSHMPPFGRRVTFVHYESWVYPSLGGPQRRGIY